MIFLLHDAEEILTIAAWTAANAERLPAALDPYLPITTGAFAWSAGLLLLLLTAICLLDLRRLRRAKQPRWTLAAVATLVANALTHVLQALLFGGYTPGLVTAVLLVAPYGAAVYLAARERGWLGPGTAILLVAGGLVLQIPLAALALWGGSLLGAG